MANSILACRPVQWADCATARCTHLKSLLFATSQCSAVQRYNKLRKQATEMSCLFGTKLMKPAVDDRGLVDPVETT